MKPMNYSDPIQERKEVVIPSNPNVNNMGDWGIVIAAALGFLKVLLAAPPFNYELDNQMIDALLNALGAIFVVVGIAKKPFLTKKDKQKKDVLQQTGREK